ncbi:MAG TPA: hypothetical protein VFW13_13340 [Phenylobacterium sp.]|nr:hypothetical protein [Phenylobacterium sp.]
MTEQHSVHAAHLATESAEAARGIFEEVVHHPVEVVTAISLSVAALLTSWSAYQAAIWDGVESAQYNKADAMRTKSARMATRSGQLEAIDILSFSQWLNAYAAGNTKLQAFYHQRFRPEFAPAFNDWIATKPDDNPAAPPTPFVMPSYQSAAMREADTLEVQAGEAFDKGEEAKRDSNHFIQITVVLASAMFFGGIVQVFKVRRVRLALMAVSVLTCAWALVRVITLPIHH